VIGGQAAEDLAADTWLQVIRKLTTFEGNDKAFRAWICTIARNRHIDWRRQTARRRKESLVESRCSTASRRSTTPSTRPRCRPSQAVALIATLPADQAEAVMLRTVAGLSVSAVAEIMGRPPAPFASSATGAFAGSPAPSREPFPIRRQEAKNAQERKWWCNGHG
jgi:RNA polymerase sigma-70 factor (ECF subfamily)